MKKWIVIPIAAGVAGLSAVSVSAVYGSVGHTDGAEIMLGESVSYSQDDLQAAAETVLAKFRSDFKGCRLDTIYYSDTRNAKEPESAKYLTMTSDFYAHWLITGAGMPSGQHIGWKWKLEKNNEGEWIVHSCGY